MSLKINVQAPNFTLASTSGNAFSLEKDLAGKPCILYFYPKDFTMGCTAEACEFRNEFEAFENVDVPIFGISKDDIPTHLRFKQQYKLPFELLADTSGLVTKMYDAVVPLIGYPQRTTYLLDHSHKIIAVYDNIIYPKGHIAAMIKGIKNQLFKEK
ncbi:MAG: peroxiredoxin [Cytophagales bacterium]|nr:MAG: peroxiredoxin [Cytophagales bacterium]